MTELSVNVCEGFFLFVLFLCWPLIPVFGRPLDCKISGSSVIAFFLCVKENSDSPQMLIVVYFDRWKWVHFMSKI